MREIKFRGYNGDFKLRNGGWIIGSFIRNDLYGLIIPLDKMAYKEYPVLVETVGQFTGLLDKNGKEIYEGDILGSEKYSTLIVGFYRSMFCTYFINAEICDSDPINDLSTSHYKIIGNIYENPELLILKE